MASWNPANQLAHLLIHRGIGTGDAVGILLDRSAQTSLALLAVLKCGAALRGDRPLLSHGSRSIHLRRCRPLGAADLARRSAALGLVRFPVD